MVDSFQMQQESQQLETLHGEDLGLLPKQALIFQDWKFTICWRVLFLKTVPIQVDFLMTWKFKARK